jgi:rfaE bifunctional protein nucleotidyltransferase chain/domain
LKNVLSSSALSKLIQSRRRGKTVVFTNGCFDLVHAGHLKVLEWAKRQGDILVVGLNSDASVRRLKGPRRPILPLADRAALMAALKPVDYVTWFSEETPHLLIKRLRPDILVKGGDWAADSIVGREFVKKVVRVPLLKGRSTSGIISTINRRYGSDGNCRTPSSGEGPLRPVATVCHWQARPFPQEGKETRAFPLLLGEGWVRELSSYI